MFEYLAHFRLVLVSGPHRSGTTICAKMIAQDTGKPFHPEETFGHDNHDAWIALVATAGGALQCPSMACYLSELSEIEDVAVVMMRRDLEDVRASQAKVGWTANGFYQERYRAELCRYGANENEDLAVVKWRAWENVQYADLVNPFEIWYGLVEPHPLWLPREKREHFSPRQTE